jgi:hypothetical protein
MFSKPFDCKFTLRNCHSILFCIYNAYCLTKSSLDIITSNNNIFAELSLEKPGNDQTAECSHCYKGSMSNRSLTLTDFSILNMLKKLCGQWRPWKPRANQWQQPCASDPKGICMVCPLESAQCVWWEQVRLDFHLFAICESFKIVSPNARPPRDPRVILDTAKEIYGNGRSMNLLF